MDINAFGETYVQTLAEQGYLKSYTDIYHLTEYCDVLIEKGLIGKAKNTDKILQAIENSKNNPPEKLLNQESTWRLKRLKKLKLCLYRYSEFTSKNHPITVLHPMDWLYWYA